MPKDLQRDEASYSWAFNVTGGEIGQGEWDSDIPRVRRVVISKGNEPFHTLTVIVADPHEDSQTRARLAMETVLDALAYKHQLQLSKPVFRGSSVPYPPGHEKEGQRVVSSETQIAWNIMPPTKVLGAKDVEIALSEAANASLHARTLRSSLRAALTQADPIAEFMLLYSVLLMRVNDAQLRLDDLVRQLQPNVKSTPSPRDLNETVYTRLRNEVGHVRKNADRFVTLAEIESVLAQFRDVVVTAVSQVH